MPAFNEERNIGRLLAELRAVDPDLEVVVDLRRLDRPNRPGRRGGAERTSFGFRSTSVSAAPCRRASASPSRAATSSPCGSTATASTTLPSSPSSLPPSSQARPISRSGHASSASGGYRSSAARRVGIRVLARVVSWIAHQRLTDTTSGFQALNRRAIALYAADLPHDYPEVEGLVMAIRNHIRIQEVPVTMREREHGNSSIGTLASVYYMIKVLLAVFVDLFRSNVVPPEDE